MRQEATREARLKFMKEARLMRRYEHKHVVRILGVAVHEHPLMIIMENCPGSFQLSFLSVPSESIRLHDFIFSISSNNFKSNLMLIS